MHLFIATIQNNKALLSNEESHHLTRVLRMKERDKVLCTDGNGKLYEATISHVHGKQSILNIEKELEYTQKRNYTTHIAVAPTKQIDRIEWFVEKGVEIGLDEVSFLECFHSERRRIKKERLDKIALNAMKQSLKAKIPTVNDLIPFADFIEKAKDFQGKKFIAHCNNDLPKNSIEKVISKKENYLFLIGPEGDFSQNEIKLAIDNHFIPISLGNQRMRTETAALNCVFLSNWVNK